MTTNTMATNTMATSTRSGTDRIVENLLREHGRTFAEEAGIRLADRPSPLYELAVLSVLSATRIRAEIAVAAARELFAAGYRTPRAMLAASWQDRVDALGRAHYRRYDESTATALGDGATMILDWWHGDLRAIRPGQRSDGAAVQAELTRLPRLGAVGSAIFCREAQGVWTTIRPFFDRAALRGAERLGLPVDPERLARLVDPDDLARFAAALVRAARQPSPGRSGSR
jgi:hypothetical protein